MKDCPANDEHNFLDMSDLEKTLADQNLNRIRFTCMAFHSRRRWCLYIHQAKNSQKQTNNS